MAVVLDLYSRRVIGWAVSKRMKRDLAIRALDMAVHYESHPETAFTIRIAAPNIAHTIIRNACVNTGSKHP